MSNKPRVYYKRALEELAPLVADLETLYVDPWIIIDYARFEILILRAQVRKLKKARRK